MQLAESAALRNITPVEEYQRYERSGYLKGSNVFRHAAALCRKGVEINLAQVIEGCGTRALVRATPCSILHTDSVARLYAHSLPHAH